MRCANTNAAEDSVVDQWVSLNPQELIDIIERLDEIITARDETIAEMQTDLDNAEAEIKASADTE